MGRKVTSMKQRGKHAAECSVPISPEEKYRSLFDHAGEGIYQSSVSGRILNINPALATLFGYRSPEEMKRNIKNAYRQIYADPKQRDRLLREVEARGMRSTSSDFFGGTRARDGVLRACTPSATPRGETAYYEGFFVDITERKRMEEKLREAHDLLEKRVVERTGRSPGSTGTSPRTSRNGKRSRKNSRSAPSSSRSSISPFVRSWTGGRLIARPSSGRS
jgi:PAS domain S-box-containing protein